MEERHNNDLLTNLRQSPQKCTLPPHPAEIFELAGLENRFTSTKNSQVKPEIAPDGADRLLAVLAPKWWEHLDDTEVLRRVMCEVRHAGKSKKVGVRQARLLKRTRIVYNLEPREDKYRPGVLSYGRKGEH